MIAATTAALEDVWKSGVKEIQAVRDKTAYDAFKQAVSDRGETLKAAAQQAAEGEREAA